jgi:hypothetical protein
MKGRPPKPKTTTGLCWNCGRELTISQPYAQCPCGKWNTNRRSGVTSKPFLTPRRAPSRKPSHTALATHPL